MQNSEPGGATPELASIARRFAALLLDTLLLALLRFLILLLIGPLLTNVLTLFLEPLLAELLLALVLDIVTTAPWYWYFWTQRAGQSPGKRMLNIRVVRVDGKPLGDREALLRVLGYYLGQLSLGLGYVWAAFDRNQQGWHDRLAGTMVVTSPAAPAMRTPP